MTPAAAILAAWVSGLGGVAFTLAVGHPLGLVGSGVWQSVFGADPMGIPYAGDGGDGYLGGWLLAAFVGYARPSSSASGASSSPGVSDSHSAGAPAGSANAHGNTTASNGGTTTVDTTTTRMIIA